MPDRPDVTTTLARFTPQRAPLNRDDLFFAAGRASAPTRRWALLLAGFLAMTQVLTVVWLWPTRPELVPPPSPHPEAATIPATPPAIPEVDPPASPYSLVGSRQNFDPLGEWIGPSMASDNLRPDQTPLHVRSRGWLDER